MTYSIYSPGSGYTLGNISFSPSQTSGSHYSIGVANGTSATDMWTNTTWTTSPVTISQSATIDLKGKDADVIINGESLKETLQAIKDGKMAFAVDQQQYAQGYMSVVLLYLNLTNAHELGGGLPIYTGPGFVTKDNVDKVMELVAAGTR